MRRYDLVFGILLILSIIDFALTAPVPAQEENQARVDVVYTPRDVISVHGKRTSDEELLKWVSEQLEKLKPVGSSDAHASSGSAPLGSDHGSTDAAQTPPLNPASPPANPGPLMEPSSPPLWLHDPPGDTLNMPSGDEASTKSSDSSIGHFISDKSDYGSDGESSAAVGPHPNPNSNPNPNPNSFPYPIHYLLPSADADPTFNWVEWMAKVNAPEEGETWITPDLNIWTDESEMKISPPSEVGDVLGHPAPALTKGKIPNWDSWADEDNPLALSPLRLTTKLDTNPNVKLANLPPSPTEVYSYPHLGSLALSSTDPRLPTVHELMPPSPVAVESPKWPDNLLPSSPWSGQGSLNKPGYELPPPPPVEVSPKWVGYELPSSQWPGQDEHEPLLPSSPVSGSHKGPENESPSSPTQSQGSGPENQIWSPPFRLGQDSLKEFGSNEPPPHATGQLLEQGLPENPDLEEVAIHNPPTSPDLELDSKSLSKPANLEGLPVGIYGIKGKAKASRSVSGTARDVGNAA